MPWSASLAAIPPDLDEEINAAKVQFWQGRFDAGAVIVERAISRGELAKVGPPAGAGAPTPPA